VVHSRLEVRLASRFALRDSFRDVR
jgi:hypothetical protein